MQMWITPDEDGLTPGYEQSEIHDSALRGMLTPVASGMAKHRNGPGIRIANRLAALYAARLGPGQSVELPHAPFLHLFVAAGSVTLEDGGALAAGDSVRLTATGGQSVTADHDAEILVWEMHATVRLG